MWVLETAQGAEPALRFRILPGHLKTIGRSTAADFVVDAALVSRVHCRVAAGAAGLEVLDLGSTNGTYVNGERVTRLALRQGDRLGIGEVELLISRAS